LKANTVIEDHAVPWY